MENATAAALAVPELLEAILSKLNIEDLFVVQRVNNTWRKLISSSKKLQRVMFLCEDPDISIESNPDLALNPLLRKLPVVRKIAFELSSRGQGQLSISLKGAAKSIDDLIQDLAHAQEHSAARSTSASWRNTLLLACQHDEFLVTVSAPTSPRKTTAFGSRQYPGAKLGDLVGEMIQEVEFEEQELWEKYIETKLAERSEDFSDLGSNTSDEEDED